ncbi:thioredoxin domain-containing protein [Desulfoprunum benzoelyticum]|uniref:Protein-disulfide isomerase n=1 Tax=Desulfoprunum benzoelyticum TaxID=1506996 RepID=A0A840USA7_9BACT|nr:thioredoxin domain-containing protein [Desulfoprunum benzoelyticum]MBB5347716.1 protein-disulfide isomerase [Desulfoprunum benzoelyticum]MBM9529309.1 thioredoxin domain-containing protein [Desulfoprunum benzoelyticum]
MRYSTIFPTTVLSLLLAVGPQASAATYTGKDDKLEWTQQQSWATSGKPLHLVRSLDGKYTFILNDQQQIVVHDQSGAVQGKIAVAKGVTAFDISPQGEFLYLIDQDAAAFTTIALDFVIAIDTAGSPVKGDAAAPVSIVLFTDFQCPYCIKLNPVLDQIYEKNKGKVKIVFKNMPLQFHQMAEPAAIAALAAGEQGKFWEFHDKLFTAPQLSPDLLPKIAQDLGLDMARFESDRNSPMLRQKLGKDMSDAQKAGVTGTPTLYINGRKLKQRSPEGFQAMIDEELAKAGK